MRDHYRGIASRYRGLPGKYGLREHRVYVRTRDFGDGQYLEIEVLNGAHPPKVREAAEEEFEVFQADESALLVGPITPKHAAGGVALETLRPNSGNRVSYRITGPGHHADGDVYHLRHIKTDRALQFTLTLTPVT